MHQGSTGGLYDLVQSLYQVTPEIQQKLTSQFEKINHHPSTCTIERNIIFSKAILVLYVHIFTCLNILQKNKHL